MTEDFSRAAWLEQARSHLREADPVLARLIDDRPAFDPRAWLAQLPPMDLYGARRLGGTHTVTEPGRTLMRSFLLAGRAPPSSS